MIRTAHQLTVFKNGDDEEMILRLDLTEEQFNKIRPFLPLSNEDPNYDLCYPIAGSDSDPNPCSVFVEGYAEEWEETKFFIHRWRVLAVVIFCLALWYWYLNGKQ